MDGLGCMRACGRVVWMWVRWVCTVRGETKSLVSMFFLASTSRTDPSIVFATPQPRLHSRRRTVFKRDHLVRGSIGFAVAADRAGQIGEARERGEMPTGAQPLLRGRRHETPAGLPACIQGPVIVADPGACPKRRITICSESSAGLRRSCRRARRGPSSEDERVASTPLQETVFRSIGWSECSHRTLPPCVLNVVGVRWSGRTTQEIRQTTGAAGP